MTPYKKLSIYTSAGSRSGTRALPAAILATALADGIYSAIAYQAISGFGPQMAIPTTNHMALDTDLPMEIRLFDQAAAIEAFLTAHQALLTTCLVTLEDVDVVQMPSPLPLDN